MMKALIVEDEKVAQAQLQRLLGSGFPDIEVVAVTDSISSTVEFLASDPPINLIFMDVELSDGECFEIFRRTTVRAQVVMTTAYDAYAVKAFEAGSIDYLLKPISVEALQRAVGRCRERLALAAAGAGPGGIDVEQLLAAVGQQKQYKARIVVRIGEQMIPVEASDFACFYSEQKANYLLVRSGEHYLVDATLDALEGELDPAGFFRISRSCIVARGAILSVNRHINGRLWVSMKPTPPFEPTVARARVDDFRRWLK